jgi:hypothetical protein
MVNAIFKLEIIMIINTQYEIGHTFWVPRSRKIIIKQELCFEGETWYKDVDSYEPLVKKKKIIKISISVNKDKTAHIHYYVIDDINDDAQISQIYLENAITNHTEEEAFEIAKKYSEEKKEYFGN